MTQRATPHDPYHAHQSVRSAEGQMDTMGYCLRSGGDRCKRLGVLPPDAVSSVPNRVVKLGAVSQSPTPVTCRADTPLVGEKDLAGKTY